MHWPTKLQKNGGFIFQYGNEFETCKAITKDHIINFSIPTLFFLVIIIFN